MSFDASSLRKALSIQEKIEALKAELNQILGGNFASDAPVKRRGRPAKTVEFGDQIDATPKKRKKRKMSAEGRARIIAAQKARWAKVKKEQKKTEK